MSDSPPGLRASPWVFLFRNAGVSGGLTRPPPHPPPPGEGSTAPPPSLLCSPASNGANNRKEVYARSYFEVTGRFMMATSVYAGSVKSAASCSLNLNERFVFLVPLNSIQMSSQGQNSSLDYFFFYGCFFRLLVLVQSFRRCLEGFFCRHH